MAYGGRAMTRSYRIYVALIPLFLLSSRAVAQTDQLIALSCNGTTTIDDKDTAFRRNGYNGEAPVKNLRFVINLTKKKITVFGVVFNIDKIDDALISFQGRESEEILVEGSMDRITGSATVIVHFSAREVPFSEQKADMNLICIPAK